MEVLGALLIGGMFVGFIFYGIRNVGIENEEAEARNKKGLKILDRGGRYFSEYWSDGNSLYKYSRRDVYIYRLGEWVYTGFPKISIKEKGNKRITIEEADAYLIDNQYDDWKTKDEQKA